MYNLSQWKTKTKLFNAASIILNSMTTILLNSFAIFTRPVSLKRNCHYNNTARHWRVYVSLNVQFHGIFFSLRAVNATLDAKIELNARPYY